MSATIVVADDHEVVRSGIVSMLKGTEIHVVGEAKNSDEATSLTLSRKPDVLLLDIRLGGEDGFIAIERIRKKMPKARVVIFSSYDNPTYVARAVTLGAIDYLIKGCTRQNLLDAIRRAVSDEAPDSRSILQRFGKSESRSRPPGESPHLTNRELQVLQHMVLGLSNREIGIALGISVETVKEHVQNILRKLDATDRTQAAVWAIKNGFGSFAPSRAICSKTQTQFQR